MAMLAFVQSGKYAGAAGRTDRRGHKGILKPNTILSQPIHIGCSNDGIARTAQRIITLIVCEQEYNTGFSSSGGTRI